MTRSRRKSDQAEVENRLTLDRHRATATRKESGPNSFDPTRSVRMSSKPEDDPTRGKEIGSNPDEDPTRTH